MNKELRYTNLSDEEVEQLILQKLREIKKALEDIREIFKKASVGYE
ncbi:MAG: hypothetical protein NZ954_01200 [Thermofilaceae archaeon]|nr:hypothetical protein [Thermofilaceae archaeon]MCX8180514.1 hypothetical protein [Thermofilaceae archaeon]